MFEVVGPTLTLRPPEVEDVAGLYKLGRDPEVTRWFSWGPYRSEAEPQAWVGLTRIEREAGQKLALVVLRAGEVVGATELGEVSRRDGRAIVGSWLARSAWGTGVNAESKGLVLYVAFTILGLRRVGAYTNVDNVRSRRALEKLGFRHEGTLRQWHRHGGEHLDVDVHGLLREEWRSAFPVTVRGELPPAWGPAAPVSPAVRPS